jgi:hypothetical protein
VDPLEDLQEEEKIAVLTDIMNSDPIQNSVNISDQKWQSVKESKIGLYNCQKFKLTVSPCVGGYAIEKEDK